MDLSSKLFTEYSSVILIGFAYDGPSNTLQYMDNTDRTEANLGSGSQLANAVHEAYNAGAKSIFTVRINGTNASVTLQDMLKISNINAGTKYNGRPFSISGGYMNIDGNIYTLSDYTDIKELAVKINADRDLNVHKYTAEIVNNSPVSSLIDVVTEFSGALDEDILSESDIYSRLDNIYYLLHSYPANIIVPLCAPYDSTQEFDTQLISFCKEKFDNGEFAIGIMSVNPPVYYESIPKDQSIQNQVDKLKGITKDYGKDGRFISVVVSTANYRNNLFYTSNCAASYAGLISLNPFKTTTNKVISGISSLDAIYTESQMNDLSNYVFIQDTVRIGLAVRYGNTVYNGFSLETSNIISHINCIVQQANYDINEIIVRNVASSILEKRIAKDLQSLIDNKEIRSVTVTTSDFDDITRYASISIDFVKYNEVRAITAQVGVYYGI
ncbi:MAG TPA: hypothetical protein VK190_03210 [Pseudoneobacillus sp.]|jgi:hypothetical protein|nr:hypothetical protein [Pseudoneobacillus sp.]